MPCKQNNYEKLSTTNAQTFFFLLESTVILKSNFQSLSVEEKSAASVEGWGELAFTGLIILFQCIYYIIYCKLYSF